MMLLARASGGNCWPGLTYYDTGLLNEPSFEPRLLTPQIPKNKGVSPKPGTKGSPSLSPAPKLGHIKRDKFNSTATMFMNTMIRAPDVNEILKWFVLSFFLGCTIFILICL